MSLENLGSIMIGIFLHSFSTDDEPTPIDDLDVLSSREFFFDVVFPDMVAEEAVMLCLCEVLLLVLRWLIQDVEEDIIVPDLFAMDNEVVSDMLLSDNAESEDTLLPRTIR